MSCIHLFIHIDQLNLHHLIVEITVCKSVSFHLALQSAAGTWPWDPWSRFPWTCSSCTCQATPSQSSQLWWSAWWPGGQYRLLCLCLPVSIRKISHENEPFWPFNHFIFFYLSVQAFGEFQSAVASGSGLPDRQPLRFSISYLQVSVNGTAPDTLFRLARVHRATSGKSSVYVFLFFMPMIHCKRPEN